MARAPRSAAVAVLAALALAGTAQAAGGNYVFAGGTAAQRAEVRAALNASSFDWGIVQEQVTIRIGRYGTSTSLPGEIRLDARLLDAGVFSWATVQDEYAHQVDYFVFTPEVRAALTKALGARAWCYEGPLLAHDQQGCERFASMLVWAYWQSPRNAYRPSSKADESAVMSAREFRTLLDRLLDR